MMLLTPPDAALLLGVKPSTLKRWRTTNAGPPWIKRGRSVYYDPEAVAGWLLSKGVSKEQGSAVVSMSDRILHDDDDSRA